MTPSARRSAANALGLAGQWIQFVMAAWLAFTEGGYLWSSIYLLAVAAPSVAPLRMVRALGLAAPGGLILLAAISDPSLPVIVAAGVFVGIGTAASGRPLAWSSGLTGGPGWAGALGAAACVVLPSVVGIRGSLAVAAGLLTLAVFAGESHDRRGSLSPVILPAALALAAVAGLRVLEPGFGGGLLRAPAIFALAWAIGTHLGWRAAPAADARAVLAAPFAAAMTMAGLGVVRGPGLVFLYGFLGACCGLVGGSSAGAPGEELPASRRFLFVGLAAGALWANAPFDYQTLIWGAAGAVLAGGFVTSMLSRRVPVPEEVSRPAPGHEVAPDSAVDMFSPESEALPVTASTQEALVRQPISTPPIAGEDPIRQAVQLLLDANRQANAIRGAALEEFRRSKTASPGMHPGESAKAPEELLARLAEIRQRLRLSSLSEG